MACNGLFGAGDNGMINPADPNRYFTLSCCEAVMFDRQVYDLIRDVELLHDMAKVFNNFCMLTYYIIYSKYSYALILKAPITTAGEIILKYLFICPVILLWACPSIGLFVRPYVMLCRPVISFEPCMLGF